MSLRFTAAIPGGTGWARQDIYEFSDSKGAADEFEERRVKWFPAGPYDTTWTALPSLVGSDISADRYHAGCSNQGGIPMCQMLAQYGRYLVRFMATMNAFDRNLTLIEVMTEAQFVRLFQEIDERIPQQLSEA